MEAVWTPVNDEFFNHAAGEFWQKVGIDVERVTFIDLCLNRLALSRREKRANLMQELSARRSVSFESGTVDG